MSDQRQSKSSNTDREYPNSTNNPSTSNQNIGGMEETFFDFPAELQGWSNWQDVSGRNFTHSMGMEAEQTMNFTDPFASSGMGGFTSTSDRSDLNAMYSTSPSITIDVPPLEPLQQYESFTGYSPFSEPLSMAPSSPLLQPGLQILPSQPSNSLQTVASPEKLSPRESMETEEDHESPNSQQGGDFRCWEHGCAGRSFSSASNFRRHRQEQAGLRRKWNCTYCGRVFTRSTARNNHMRDGHCQQRKNSGQSQSERKSRSPG